MEGGGLLKHSFVEGRGQGPRESGICHRINHSRIAPGGGSGSLAKVQQTHGMNVFGSLSAAASLCLAPASSHCLRTGKPSANRPCVLDTSIRVGHPRPLSLSFIL